MHHSKASPCRRGRTGRAFGAVVCVVMLGLAFPAAARAPTGDERTALEALYDATDGDNWKRKRRWKSDQNGSWHGVTVRAGNVRKLELAGNKLNGSIPEGIFADLPYLEVVNLADNVLSGAIPADVADLSSLMTLDLSRNGLTGSIPSELGGLSNLTTLNLSRNGLTGSIPTVLGNASSLANLNLAGNGLTGSIPTELGDLPNLIDLRVGDNSLSGTIPTEFTESGDLRELHAQNTGITLPDDADFLTWAAGENRVVTVGTRTASRILELEAPEAGTVGLPIGVWSDGKTIWVAEYGTRNVLAYRLATGARNADKDIRLNINNDEPTGLWSDGTTMWVGDFTWLKLFAYRLSDGTYLPEESVSVDTYGQGLAMWSDGDTWWIGVNSKHTGVRGFEAYSDTRRPEADFPLASTNTYHIGMVSDGTTMWVVDTLDERLYAYSTEDGTHQPFGYQVLDPRNSHPRGAWSDGTTLYVVDSLDRVLYGYSPDATLSALALADGADNAIDLNPAFAPDETAYEAEVVGDRITVLATADDLAATVEYVDANGAAIADQDPVAQGHQMNLVAGANVVRVRVGSADGFASKTYAVSVTSTRPELVTNLGETLDDAALSSVVAQRFTTGSSPYRLHSVTIQLDALGSDTSSGDTHLTVWSESGDEPGMRIAKLTSPTLQESGPNTFVVKGDRVFLNPGMDYFLVVNHGLAEDARIPPRLTQTTSEMSDFGWRIADTVLHSTEASPTSWDEMVGVLSMRVSGDELRECAVDLEGRTEVWSSTLTVGPIKHLAAYIDSYGFRRDRNAGALSKDDFDFRSAAGVEIDRLAVRTVDGTLVFDESPDLPDADRRALRLHVCVDVFDLADATLETQLGLTTWADAGMDWSALRTVSVALSEMSYDATLSGLEVADAAGNAIELDDDFAPYMVAYTAMVANAIVRITVTPTADPADATIGYKDGADALLTDADPDADGFQVDLIPGDNVVRVEVTGSADGATTLTYTVTVERGFGTIPADWSLKPDAVGAGETFRLMFVSTTTRNGSSTDIADYNTHVQDAAAAGRAEIRPYSADFTAIGSTAAVNARDNTQTGSTHTDAPIYWVHTGRSRGAVADNYADFYDGTWGNTTVRDQSGTSTTLIASTSAITGTDLNGRTNGPLGSDSVSAWYLSSGTLVQGSSSPGNLRRLLALSPIFRVAPPDATLSDLELKDNDGAGITLTPAFASVTTSYRATVANAVDEITVVPTPNDTAATVEIQDEDGTALVDADTGTDGFQVALRWGDNTIQVEVTAMDGTTTTIGLYTVIVSRALARPSVSPTGGSTTGLDVSWEAPGHTTIVSYDVQYREGDSGGFTDGPQDVTVTITSIPGLMMNTSYQVQVRATSAAGDSEWSPNGRGWTHAPEATVASGWRLLPGGLATGEKFRLLFVSHELEWNRSQIDSYNEFVQGYAATERGHTDIRAHASGFRAVGCGKWVNARVNTGTQWSASDRGVPIHWLGGLTAADDYGDFYDGTWQNEDAPRTEAGALKPASFNGRVFTGCTNAGDTVTGAALGQEFSARGRLDADNAGPLGGGDNEKGNKPIYGLSQVFVVGASSDVTAPRVASIERRTPSSSPTNADSLTWRVTFNENVGNVDAADFAVAATTASLAVVEATASTVYDVIALGGDLAGLTATVTLSFASAQDIADTAGNALSNTAPTGANQASYAVDNTGPTVTIAVPGTSSAPFEATFAFSEAVSGFGVGDIGVGNGAASDFMGADGDASYSAEIAPAANGAVTVDVAADVATDAAGNGNTAAAQATSDYTDANEPPTFNETDPTSRAVDENTASNQSVGAAVSASDAEDDTLTYDLEGTDAGSFGIDTGSGQLRTSAALDHESKSTYAVTVTVGDGNGGTATIDVTVNVTDVDEQPARPATPTVAATANTTDSVDVGWAKPALDGGPDIVGYKLQYEVSGSGSWTETTPSGTGTTATIGTLAEDTEYAVQVRALNGETPSDWSASGTGRTGGGSNTAPEFDDSTSTTREVAENTASGQPVGAAVSATDAEDDTLKYTLEGADAASFRIGRTTGRLRTSAALDHEAKPSHTLTVKADDERGGTATIIVTVNVTDVDEPPAAPSAPTVSAVEGSATSLSVRWSAPANTGPPVTDYDLRHKKTGGSWTDGPENVTGRSAMIGGLARDTEYEVQVLARNDEGESGWSPSGRRTTGQAARSVHMEDVTVHEGETARFTIVFSPARSDDRLLWETHDNRARAGRDFPRTSRGIALQAGATEVTGEVEIYADDEAEDEEGFQIAITFGDVGDTVEYAGSITIRDGARPYTPPTDTVYPVPADWSLKPDAVASGGKFRLLFVTTATRDGSSTDIADYNIHVQTAAAAGHADIQAYSGEFGAIGSTAAVNVRDNTLTTSSHTDAPIYWLSTTTTRRAVADFYADFYDGTWGDTSARTESGGTTTIEFRRLDADNGSVVTGSDLDGTTFPEAELGGDLNLGWWLSGHDVNREFALASTARRLLALSPIFMVPATKLVTNESESQSSAGNTAVTAQEFRTGTNTGGYEVDAVWLKTSAGTAFRAGDTHVRIMANAAGGGPGNEVAALTSPATIGSGLDAFVAPAGTVLDPETIYHVVTNWGIAGDTARLSAAQTDSNAEQSGLGWTIGDTRRFNSTDDEPTTWTTSQDLLLMRVTGREVTATNSAPVFSDGTRTTREVAENTASGQPVGRVVEADDADDDPLTYTLGGADAASFGIDRTTGQLRTSAALDHESKSTYEVTVTVADDDDTATIAVTVNVTDVAEKPAMPAAPTVTATANTTDSVDVSWRKPGLDGGPDIVGYKLQYEVSGSGSWTETTPSGTGTTATIGTLAEGTEYAVQVRALNGETPSDWSPSGTGRTGAGSNTAPVFADGTSTTREVAENTASGQPVGRVVEADDADDDTLTYTLEGADAASFGIDRTTGQLRTSAALDHEAKASYTLTVKADDERGGTATIVVTVNVEDVAEKPATPVAPEVSATANATDSLDVAWTKPGLDGGPNIVGYKLRYEVSGSGSWTETTPSGTGTTATIGTLAEDTGYAVQVRALNGETPSDWSPSGTGRTGAGSNTAPEFDTKLSTTREVAENTASGQPVGAAVSADDADDDPLTYTLEGADAASFGIDRTTGQLRTSAALDHEAKASYTLTVKADDERGGTATIVVTVNVEDVAEKPATPVAPEVSATANATDSLDVAWTKPGLDGGPNIVGYKLRYEVSGSGSWTETTPSGTGTTATIGTLAEDTGYAVQVRALNGETPSDWSPSGTGRTGAGSNTAPEFDTKLSTTREVAENTASGQPVGAAVSADDADDDPLTYTLEGADAASFGIDRTTGQLRTAAALDHEAKASYTLRVKADDDHGGTARIVVTVNVEDVAEKPATPAAPRVSATANSTDSLDVAWRKPGLDGGPDIIGYRLRRGVRGGSGWFETTTRYLATARSATIGGLAEDTEYDVRVRALNGEDTSDWSPPGFGRTGANAAPVFDDGARTTRSVAENTASGRPVGRPVSADDANDDELTYTLEGGPDAGSFGIDSRTGQLRTSADLDHESKASHALTVKADDGEGGTATIDVTVNATDVDEPPRAPDAPTVEGSATSLSVRWIAPENTGPPATYDLRYRETGGGSWTDGPENVAGRSASIDGLAADTEYEVQVLARNDEGGSGWSASGRGRTDGGGRSVYMEDVAVYEGETARFTIVFSPARSDDRLLWETHDNRARAGRDFPRTGRGIALQAGATEVTGEVEIYADDEAEDEERFQIDITFGDVGDTVEYAGSIYIRDGARPASANPSARVVGDLLTLRYADALDAGSTPGPKDWVVRAATATGSRTLAVTGVSVSGAEVALVLSPAAAAGESVAVSYLPWAMHPLLGPQGAEAGPLTELPVRNETPASVPVEPPLVPVDVEAALAEEPTAGTPAPFGPWLSALLAERPAASLVRLDLPDRGLTDISALAGLTGLEVLDLHGNELADVWPLAGLANLRRLDLSANRIEDVSALAGLAELEVLLLDGNRVADVLPLALLPRLARLDLSGNRVADAALLAELRSLARLDLSGNRVADASPLGDLSGLVWLDLSGNPVADVSLLGRLTALRWLWLGADAPGLWALAPLAERPAPVRIELGAPAAPD